MSAFAYLDLLGFSSYATNDPDGALRLLGHYQQIFQSKLYDDQLFPASSYPDPSVQALARRHSVSSFKDVAPFSDSLFVHSEILDDFVPQLSTFLLACFRLTSDAYSGPTGANPTQVSIKQFGPTGITKRAEHWYPVLFRGGMSIRDVQRIGLVGRAGFKPTSCISFSGPGVIEAVGLERTGKGPRIFCTQDVVSAASKWSDAFQRIDASVKYEVLWPMFAFNDANQPRTEFGHFVDLFVAAVNLWKAQRGNADVEPHYFAFLELIVQSTLKWFTLQKELSYAEQAVGAQLRAHGLDIESNFRLVCV